MGNYQQQVVNKKNKYSSIEVIKLAANLKFSKHLL